MIATLVALPLLLIFKRPSRGTGDQPAAME